MNKHSIQNQIHFVGCAPFFSGHINTKYLFGMADWERVRISYVRISQSASVQFHLRM